MLPRSAPTQTLAIATPSPLHRWHLFPRFFRPSQLGALSRHPCPPCRHLPLLPLLPPWSCPTCTMRPLSSTLSRITSVTCRGRNRREQEGPGVQG